MQRGNRKEDAGEKVPRDWGPFLVPHPGAKAGAEGSREREEGRTYSAVLLREEVGAVVQAFLQGRGTRRTRGEDGVGETQRETLVLGRRGPRARPAPAAPTARPGLGAAGTPTIMAAPRRGPAHARTAPRGRREPAAAGEAGLVAAGGGGVSEQPAPPRPGAGGRGR